MSAGFSPERILIEAGAEDLPMTRRILARLPGVPVETLRALGPWIRQTARDADAARAAKNWLVISRYPGTFLKKCPGTQGFVCCNYWVINAATGCPLDCTYCILQGYLENNPMIRVFANTDTLFSELERAFAAARGRRFRVGTGELTDSLALDGLTDLSRELVPFFARHTNAQLELKTKTDQVGNLLDLAHQGRTVIGWSVNPPPVIASDEQGTAPLARRLRAAERCQSAGYPVSFHFDPMVLEHGWEGAYREVVRQIFETVPATSIAWISLGGLRFAPELKPIMRRRFPESRLVCGELVPCPDRKLRYLRTLRVPAYRRMLRWIRALGPQVPVYLCMESRDVWEAVYQGPPSELQNLEGLFG